MEKSKKTTNKQPEFDANQAAQALEYLFAMEYVDKKKLYLQNFLRGIFFSLGTIVGAAVVVTLLLWVLSLFDNLPFIGEIVDNAKNTLDNR